MTRRQRRVRRRQGGPRKKIVAAAAVVGGLLLTAVFAAGGWVFSIASDAPDVDTLKEIDKGQNSVIYAGDGSRLGLIDSDEVRPPISIKEIPKTVQNATISIEDERFMDHDGVDIEGILRAATKNLESGEISEGASTITMQLMRNIYIVNPAARLRAEDRRGQDGPRLREGPLEAADPREVPEHRPLRHQPGPHRDRRRGRLQGLLLDEAGEAHPSRRPR